MDKRQLGVNLRGGLVGKLSKMAACESPDVEIRRCFHWHGDKPIVLSVLVPHIAKSDVVPLLSRLKSQVGICAANVAVQNTGGPVEVRQKHFGPAKLLLPPVVPDINDLFVGPDSILVRSALHVPAFLPHHIHPEPEESRINEPRFLGQSKCWLDSLVYETDFPRCQSP